MSFIRSNFVRIIFQRCHSTKPTSHQQAMMARGLPKRTPIEGVQHIIAIGSGKGISNLIKLFDEVNYIEIKAYIL